jgi:hypothetical protein
MLVSTAQVTIVAVLQRLGANEDLFALVFGKCLPSWINQRIEVSVENCE